MKAPTIVAFLLFPLAAHVAASGTEPEVLALPFEPLAAHFFKPGDKFAHPPEVTAPKYLFPFDGRRHAGSLVPAEVIVLVQLNGKGFAKTLKVLSSTQEMFTNATLTALKKAQWNCSDEIWFYCRAVYTLDE
jgi:hypothetical protein